MTRSQSIEALNEATVMASKLSWILFKAEIWFDHEDGGWVPGEPLYKDPREQYIDYEYDEDGNYVGGYNGVNTIRPMFQLLDEAEETMRCKTCQVSWPGDDSCWICGKECPTSYRPYEMAEFPYVMYNRADVEMTRDYLYAGGYRLHPMARREFEEAVARREAMREADRQARIEERRRRLIREEHERQARLEQLREQASVSYAYTDGDVTFQITRETYDRLREEWGRVTGRPDDLPPSLRWAREQEAVVPSELMANPIQTDDDLRDDGRPPIPVRNPWWRQFQRAPWERFRRSR